MKPRRAGLAWLGGPMLMLAAGPAPAADSEPLSLALRYLVLSSYVESIGAPPCGLDRPAPADLRSARALLESMLGENRGAELRRIMAGPVPRARVARAPRDIDAQLKAGESAGAARQDVCRGLLAQFDAARGRVLERLRDSLD